MTPLALSQRAAARLLGVDRGSTLVALIRAGRLRMIPWGTSKRIPLAEVERLAAEGFTLTGRRPRAPRHARPARPDPDALRRLDLEAL